MNKINNKINDISNGWKNLLIENTDVEVIAKERLKICMDCTFLNKKRFNRCRVCGCPVEAKVRSVTSTNKCPMNYWLAIKQNENPNII